jgi:hypothetical protein
MRQVGAGQEDVAWMIGARQRLSGRGPFLFFQLADIETNDTSGRSDSLKKRELAFDRVIAGLALVYQPERGGGA